MRFHLQKTSKMRISFALLLCTMYSIQIQAQVGIGTTNPHPSAVLDVASDNKGFLLPRLSQSERDNIVSPSDGLMIYNTDDNCINYRVPNSWVNPCNPNQDSGGSGSGGSTPTLPTNFFLQANSTIYISSVYDNNYFPYTPPTAVANTNTQVNPDATPEAKTIDYQGYLTTSGLTLQIPYLVFGSTDVTLDTITVVNTIDAAYTESGSSSVDVQLQIPGSTLSPGSGFITATLKALNSDLDAKKLDINAGMGTDIGVLISEFIVPTDESGNTDTVQLKIVPGIPDKSFGDGDHDFVYLPIQAEDGNLWLTNNLGAEYANINSATFNIGNKATSSNDQNAYGSLFQWGRPADGHELMNYTSSNQGTRVNPTTTSSISNTSTPIHNNFITNNAVPYDWISPQDNSLWDGANTPNNPCPDGFRLPTQIEWSNYKNASGINTISEAASSHLGISGAGYTMSNGNIDFTNGDGGFYWAGNSTVIDNGGSPYTKAWSSFFSTSFVNTSANNNVFGFNVRCIQNETNISSTSNGTAVISSVNNCSVNSTGTLTAGVTPSAGVTQTINVTVTKAGSYTIFAFNNGVAFFGSGIVNLGNQDIVLTANTFGSPTNSGTTTFTLNIPSGCSFDRVIN